MGLQLFSQQTRVMIAGIIADDHYLFFSLLLEQLGIHINDGLAVDGISQMNKGFDGVAQL